MILTGGSTLDIFYILIFFNQANASDRALQLDDESSRAGAESQQTWPELKFHMRTEPSLEPVTSLPMQIVFLPIRHS